MSLSIGDAAPNIKLLSSSGREISLSDFAGKLIVLYFYPKDDTPGCTTEACDFRDNKQSFDDLDAVIVGVSKDPLKSHEKFINKYDLPFELLSDEDLELMKAFGVWTEKSMYGKTFMGVQRSTFLIGRDGKIAQAWPKVRVKNHVAKVLEAAHDL